MDRIPEMPRMALVFQATWSLDVRPDRRHRRLDSKHHTGAM
jgi:hypothetical protein